MKVASVLVLLSILPLTLGFVYAQEPTVMEQITNSGNVKVQLFWPEVLPDQLYIVELQFLNPQNNEPISDLIYNVEVRQNGETIEIYNDQHAQDGMSSFEVVFPEDGTGPAQVMVGITAMGSGTTTSMNESVFFNVQVVPEFPALPAVVIALPLLAAVLLGIRMRSRIRIS